MSRPEAAIRWQIADCTVCDMPGPAGHTRVWWRDLQAARHAARTGHPVVCSEYPTDYRGDPVTKSTVRAAALRRGAAEPVLTAVLIAGAEDVVRRAFGRLGRRGSRPGNSRDTY